MNDRTSGSNDRNLVIWLLVCALTIYGMIVLGGVTRLTESGLSIVEWKPVVGVLPPLNEGEWRQEFEKYQQFPEYQKVNTGMDLEGFKQIFWLEYLHRLLGRLIGVLFFFPLVVFWWRGQIRPGFKPHLSALFVLGGLQGVLGWYMVKSGLVDNPRVSQYRLTAHLGLAVLIYGYMLWLIARLLWPAQSAARHWLARLAVPATFVMILSGGLVAGIRAGHAYNTWPLMAGEWIPPGLYDYQPGWLAAFEQITTVQFNHRLLAYLLTTLLVLLAVRLWRDGARTRPWAVFLLAALALQLCLGVSTLLLAVPIWLGALHQAGAVLLFTAVLLAAFHCAGADKQKETVGAATVGVG